MLDRSFTSLGIPGRGRVEADWVYCSRHSEDISRQSEKEEGKKEARGREERNIRGRKWRQTDRERE